MTSDFDAKVREVEAGVLYWPIFLELQLRRLANQVVVSQASLLPSLDFVGVARQIGLPIDESTLSLQKSFREPEELVERHGKRLWYWVKHENEIARLLLVCLMDKNQAEAKEILRVEEEDSEYLVQAAQILNRAAETSGYSNDVLFRVVQYWVWFHGSLTVGDWETFSDVHQSLAEVVAFIRTLKKRTTDVAALEASAETEEEADIQPQNPVRERPELKKIAPEDAKAKAVEVPAVKAEPEVEVSEKQVEEEEVYVKPIQVNTTDLSSLVTYFYNSDASSEADKKTNGSAN